MYLLGHACNSKCYVEVGICGYVQYVMMVG